MRLLILLPLILFLYVSVLGQETRWMGKFEQLGTILPSPNEYRTGAGSPGSKYWQQFVEYDIKVQLDEKSQSITGEQTIKYFNNSPNDLNYLWLQLDQNIRKSDSEIYKESTQDIESINTTKKALKEFHLDDFQGGINIILLTDGAGGSLNYTINKTMMRVDLPQPLKAGSNVSMEIKWNYNIQDRMVYGGRSGSEYFPDDDNYIFAIAQFYPRMCVYDDVEGWQIKQFSGVSEFALPFGNFDVSITVPSDHIVAATGTLQNYNEVLTRVQLDRYEEARKSVDRPVKIVSEKEAVNSEASKSVTSKTWAFKARNVRDFAFASSRKFIWEAQAVDLGNNRPLAMAYYPKEGNPLWEREALPAIKKTLEFYSEYCFEYPYPVAQAVNCASMGMEYPMISFNRGRAKSDDSYSVYTKYKMIEVIIHEIGHNYFPMIINSDERKWAWMDEGLNTFLENRTKIAKYDTFPPSDGDVNSIIKYMSSGPDINQPIMTSPEQLIYKGQNSYYKPAAALTILRETIMGHELFDSAFKEYCKRWAYKHPKPADFFRTMEDASAVDLDWFWRGWFFSNDYVDISIDNVIWYKLNTENKSGKQNSESKDQLAVDFSNGPKSFTLKNTPIDEYREFLNRVDEEGIRQKFASKNLYEITFSNIGGLVMPIILEFTFKDGTKLRKNLPAEIWRLNEEQVTKVFVLDKEVTNVVLDPDAETSDVNTLNNVFPKSSGNKMLDTSGYN